jgi:hypothetical protein
MTSGTLSHFRELKTPLIPLRFDTDMKTAERL